MAKKKVSRQTQHWHRYLVEAVCAINLVLLAGVPVFTASTPWFNERAAVVVSMLWLLSTIPAAVAVLYGLAIAKKPTPKSRKVVCWVTLSANIVFFVYMLQLFQW